MTRKDVFDLLKAAGAPVAYRDWADAEPPPLPYIVYFFTGDNDLIADNENYSGASKWCAELYSKTKDDALEGAVEAALKAAHVPYSKSEVGRVSERRPLVTAYYFQTIGD